MKEIILIGGGGHCKSVIDVIEQEGKFQIDEIPYGKYYLVIEYIGYEDYIVDNITIHPPNNLFFDIGIAKITIKALTADEISRKEFLS